MKKNFLNIFLLFLIAFSTAGFAFAADITPTVDPKLLQEIASKTAQLNLVEKKGIVGIVSDASDTQLTITDTKGNTRFVDVDELTKFYSPTSTSFGISDINKGMRIGVLGLYNKQSKRILARQIDSLGSQNKIIYGAITEVDKTNFEITLVKESGEKVIAEIEDITKTYSYSSGITVKSGFSKIAAPQTAILIGNLDKQDTNKILAARIILFPDVSINPNINLEDKASPSIVPSTGSGKKLTPIVK